MALSEARLMHLSEALRAHVDRGAVAGIVGLVACGDVVHVDAHGVQNLESRVPMRRETIFRIASMTKPVTAAAAMILVEEGRIGLDDSVERWLPELKNRRVLRQLEASLDDTVPAARPITLRDLLTFRLGLGAVMAPPGTYPIQAAMENLGVQPGPHQIPVTPDEYMERIGRLPLIHQPGERWMYHTGADILAVLIARVAGMPLEAFLTSHIFEPLGMIDTAFSVPEEKIDRLATCYVRGEGSSLRVWDAARGGLYARPPAFPNALVSTADDYLAFGQMMLRQGCGKVDRVLASATLQLMMSDQITPAQKAVSPFFPGFWDHTGWGFGGAVVIRPDRVPASPGSYGWNGGFGTTFIVDPVEDMVAILLIQRLMSGADDTTINEAFLTHAYQAIKTPSFQRAKG